MPQLQAKAPTSPRKKRPAGPVKSGSKKLAVAPDDKKSKMTVFNLGGAVVTIDAGPLLNIASTVDLETARRAARRAGILTPAGKLSSKYR